MKEKILVIDDEKLICWSLKKDLEKKGYIVFTALTAREGLQQFEKEFPELVLLDVQLPDGNGVEILQVIRRQQPNTAVIMITANDDVRTAVKSLHAGAYTYLQKPVNFEELCLNIERGLESQKLRQKVEGWNQSEKGKYTADNVVAESAPMQKIIETVRQVASSSATTVLLQGESGTGKDLIARMIHYGGNRSNREFVSINCAAVPENLLESELFGHEKGAFTDARQTKKGLVGEANGGTLFLDEIGDMQKGLQAKLLHLIDVKQFRPVGGVQEVEADIRVIAATNRDLKAEVAAGRFREDLYYRLNVIFLQLTPLRERKEDIPQLVAFFIGRYNQQFRKSIQGVHKETLEILVNYDWPGNVRELRNVIERAMILNQASEIRAEHLPAEIDNRIRYTKNLNNPEQTDAVNQVINNLLGVPLATVEKQLLVQALEAAKGNQSKAARTLGVGRDALRYKMQKFGLSPESEKTEEVGENTLPV